MEGIPNILNVDTSNDNEATNGKLIRNSYIVKSNTVNQEAISLRSNTIELSKQSTLKR